MYPLVVTNIAMENAPFIDDFPIKTSIYKGFSMVMLNNQRVNLTALRMNMEPVEMVSWQGLHPHFGGIPRWSHLLHVGWGAPATIHAARNSLVPSWVASSTLWKSLRKMTSSVPWQHGPGCLLIPISRWSRRLKQRRRSRSYSPLFHQQSVVPAVACWFMSRIYRFMTHIGLIGRVTEPLCHHGMEEPGCESLWITNSLRSAKHCQNIWETFFKVFCRGEGRRWKTIGKLKPMEKHSKEFQPIPTIISPKVSFRKSPATSQRSQRRVARSKVMPLAGPWDWSRVSWCAPSMRAPRWWCRWCQRAVWDVLVK